MTSSSHQREPGWGLQVSLVPKPVPSLFLCMNMGEHWSQPPSCSCCTRMIYQVNYFTASCQNLENCGETEVMKREVEKRRGLGARPVIAVWVVGSDGRSDGRSHRRVADLRVGSLERLSSAAKRQA